MYRRKFGKVLVIGYGNDLRGEDCAGRIAVEEIASWHHADVDIISVHQLGPEHAQEISEAHTVVFVDAFAADEPVENLLQQPGIVFHQPARTQMWTGAEVASHRADRPLLIRLRPSDCVVAIGHACNPAALLLLAKELYGRSPRAYMVGIPAYNFEFGAEVSDKTYCAITEAVELVKMLALWTLRPAQLAGLG